MDAQANSLLSPITAAADRSESTTMLTYHTYFDIYLVTVYDTLHQQSGQCIYITNMQNMNPALFCILIFGFAYYLAYYCIYKQNNMHNMQNSMQKNSAGFIESYSAYSAYCNMQNRLNMSNHMLQYANQYAEYAK
jgi:hypothetical protein